MCDCIEELFKACGIDTEGEDGNPGTLDKEATIGDVETFIPYSFAVNTDPTTARYLFTVFEGQTVVVTGGVITTPTLPNPLPLQGYLPLDSSEFFYNNIPATLTNDSFTLPPGKYSIELLFNNNFQIKITNSNLGLLPPGFNFVLTSGQSTVNSYNMGSSVLQTFVGTLSLESTPSATVIPNTINFSSQYLFPFENYGAGLSQMKALFILESPVETTNRFNFNYTINLTTVTFSNNGTFQNTSFYIFSYNGSIIRINKL